MLETTNNFSYYDWYHLFHNGTREVYKPSSIGQPISHDPVDIKDTAYPVDPADVKYSPYPADSADTKYSPYPADSAESADCTDDADLTGPQWLRWYQWPCWPDWTYWPKDDKSPSGIVTASLSSIWSKKTGID